MTISRELVSQRNSATAPRRPGIRRSIPLAVAVLGALSVGAMSPAHADDAELQALKKQVQELQQKIEALATRANAAPAAAPVASAPAPAQDAKPSTSATLHAGPVDVTLGGFVELMVVGRSKNEAADWASNWNTSIPFAQSQNGALSDFRLTERQSRVQALATAPADSNVKAEAYIEADFGGGPRTANNNESTSFSPRVRHFYADYTDKTNDWTLLFGQTWSLITQDKHGIEQRNELIPLTIDGQYVPGFTWTRAPQVRFVKNFGGTVALGLSVENPAALVAAKSGCGNGSSTAVTTSTPFCGTAGGSGYDANNNITLDPAPDVVAKLAVDPGYGHYEVYGLERSFRDRYKLSNNTTTATSVGGSILLPLVPKTLDFMVSGLAGKGIGRYGSAQLPDVTVNPSGELEAIKGYDLLVGLTLKATPSLTLYVYGGREHDDKTDFSNAGGNAFLGYGSPLYDNSNCLVEGSSGKCDAQTSTVSQATIGGWWKFYQGGMGNFQFGAQLTHVKRETYAGIGPVAGTLAAPSVSMNVGELSFRYYPYQK